MATEKNDPLSPVHVLIDTPGILQRQIRALAEASQTTSDLPLLRATIQAMATLSEAACQTSLPALFPAIRQGGNYGETPPSITNGLPVVSPRENSSLLAITPSVPSSAPESSASPAKPSSSIFITVGQYAETHGLSSTDRDQISSLLSQRAHAKTDPVSRESRGPHRFAYSPADIESVAREITSRSPKKKQS